MNPLAYFAVALWSCFGVAIAAAAEPASDGHALQEVHSLSKLPQDVAKALGWQHSDRDEIADLEAESGSPAPTAGGRWFLLGGLSKTFALVAIEEEGGRSLYPGFHAKAFSLVGDSWIANGEWMLSSPPHTIDELEQLLRSPESQALTALWRQKQRDFDLQQRIMHSDPNGSYRPRLLREINISDDEVRQIVGVVRALIPGAIVMISGVAQGCPCADGPGCTAQVWTAVQSSQRTGSIELSDINDHWVLGPVQRWFLESEQLEPAKFPTFAAYAAAQEALNNRFPACAKGASTIR